MADNPDQNTPEDTHATGPQGRPQHPDQPTWVPRLAIEAAHHDQLVEHGGLQCIRDKNAREAASARLQQRRHYEPYTDLAALAAAYAFGIATAHPFADGNKRTAYVTAEMFLALNGYTVSWSDAEVVETMLAVAAREMMEDELASWFRAGLAALPPDKGE